MCIVFIYVNSNPKHSKYRIILASNRDEFYNRPTSPAKTKGCKPEIICGEDKLEGREGGTWLGVSSFGKIGCLLNLSSGTPKTQKGASRGFLVKDYLQSDLPPKEYINQIVSSGIKYDYFSIILLKYLQTNHEVYYYDNVEKQSKPLSDGVHGFSNSIMSKSFQKVVHGKSQFLTIVEKFNHEDLKDMLENSLFNLMHSKMEYFPDEILSEKKTLPEHIIPKLSSNFVHIPEVGYGTRTTTIILVGYEGNVSFTEKTSTGNYLDTKTWLHSQYCLNL